MRDSWLLSSTATITIVLLVVCSKQRRMLTGIHRLRQPLMTAIDYTEYFIGLFIKKPENCFVIILTDRFID